MNHCGSQGKLGGYGEEKSDYTYKKNGRSNAWWETDLQLQDSIEEASAGLIDRMLEDGSRGKSFYAATRKLSLAVPSQQWSVSDLFPDKSPTGVWDEMLTYYGSIVGLRRHPCRTWPVMPGALVNFPWTGPPHYLGTRKNPTHEWTAIHGPT